MFLTLLDIHDLSVFVVSLHLLFVILLFRDLLKRKTPEKRNPVIGDLHSVVKIAFRSETTD